MKALEAVLLTLRANEEIEETSSSMPIGRTAMQKLVYFATQKRLDIDATFYAHYYGPFSKDVAEGIARLWGYGYVQENPPSDTNPGYAYTLTPSDGVSFGKKVLDDGNQASYSKILSILKTCRNHCRLRQLELSRAAKVHYLNTKHRSSYDVDKIIASGSRIGWELSTSNVNTGLRLLHALGIGPRQL